MPGRMGAEDWNNVWLYFLLLALISAGLVRLRGVPVRVVVRNLALWLTLVALSAVAYAYRQELSTFADRLTGQTAAPPQAAAEAATPRQHEIILPADAGGQFAILGQVSGVQGAGVKGSGVKGSGAPGADIDVRLVIDTGAPAIAFTPGDARRLGIDTAALTYARPSPAPPAPRPWPATPSRA
jgi:predicted aspartyl protease